MKTPDSLPARPASDPATRAIQRQAAEWLALREARDLTVAEQGTLERWCAADPRHAALLTEVETAYRTFDRLAFYPRPSDGPIDPDLLVRRPRFVLAPVLLAAAAMTVIAAVFWGQVSMPVLTTPAAVPAGGPQFLRLADGSKVELNSGSEVVEHFTATERRIRLVRGEAHFEVTKNTLRPFIVEANNVSVRAVGTAFDVRLGATAVEVLVTEGKVGVTAADRPLAPFGRTQRDDVTSQALGPGLILVAGQRTAVPTISVPQASPALIVEDLSQHQIDRALSWQCNRLVFDAMPLAAVVERFNRSPSAQNGLESVHLQVRDTDLGRMLISGRIRYDRVDNFLEVLQKDFGVSAERHGAVIVLRRAR